MNYKTLIVYAVIVIVIALGVAYALSNTLLAQSYSLSASISRVQPQNHTYPYQTSYFNIVLNNTGPSQISSIPVLVYLNNNTLKAYKVTLPGRKGTVISVNYTYPNTGTYDFRVVADPAHVFQITNRSNAQGNLVINVTQAQAPNAYTSLPSANITSTTAFTIDPNGAGPIGAIGLGFNLSAINAMLGPAHGIIAKTLLDLAQYISVAHGAIAYYPGNAIGYSLWMQGSLDQRFVSAIVQSYNLQVSNFNANGTQAMFTKINNSTSLCFYYSGGWTKVVSYYNGTNSVVTCQSILAKAYTSNESAFLTKQYNTTDHVQNLSSAFRYLNTTYLGGSISYQNANIATTSVFTNNFGAFITYLQRNAMPANIATNQTCNGLIYNNGNINVCSSFVSAQPSSGQATYLIDETMVTSNYTAVVYSFTNQSSIALVNQNGINLLIQLNLSKHTQGWNSMYKNSCNINASLSCNLLSFSRSNGTASISVTNNFAQPIKLNNLLCTLRGGLTAQGVNSMIAAGSSLTVNTICYNILIPIASLTTSFHLTLNYTINGTTKLDHGFVNVTNIQ